MLNIVDDIKKLIEYLRNFAVRNSPSVLRIVADIFEKAVDIADAFFKSPVPALAVADRTDEDCCKDCDKLCQTISANPDASFFDPSWVLLVVELINRLLKR